MRIGENYLKYNAGQEWVNPFKVAYRQLLSAGQDFTAGDDLSHWNTVNDWFAKRSEMKFSVLKIGEGGSPNADADLFTFAEAAKFSNTQVMLYWFFRSNYTGELQAGYALAIANQVASLLGYKPRIWADVETTDNMANVTRIDRLGKFLAQVDAWQPERPCGVYSSPGFANLYLTPTPTYINTHPQWIAHWTSAPLPTQPNGWNTAMRKLWQIGVWDNHSWCASVPGCQPDIDRNRFFGNEADLSAFTGAGLFLTLEQRVAYLESIAHTH